MSQLLSTDSPAPSPASPSALLSPAEMFARLSPSEQHSLLEDLAADAGCTLDEIKVELAYRWEGWFARPTQLEPPGDWLYWLLKAGRGYGKTRIGAEWTRKKAKTCRRLHLIAPTAADYRDVMINGESGLMEISPRHERPVFYPSKRLLVWPNGSQALLFSGEDPESLRGPQCEALWADEIAAWQYPQETWDMALLGLRLGDDPQACITSTPKPIGVYRDLVNDVDCVVTGGSTYENLANLSRTYRTIINRYEGTNLGRQELHAELLENEGLAYRFSERLHVLPAGQVEISQDWDRFEHMDYGLSAATAWYAVAVDHDGNLIIFDGHYEGGLPSVDRPADPREARRLLGSRPQRQTDPEPVPRRPGRVRARQADQVGPRAGRQRRVRRARHPPDCAASNDRVLGFVRISELLNAPETRLFPDWHPRRRRAGRAAAVHPRRPRHPRAARAAAGRAARGRRQAAPRRGRRSRLGTLERPRARVAAVRVGQQAEAVEAATTS
jgi:hypothetical protein